MLGSYAVWCFSVKALWLVCKRVVRIWWRDPGPNGGDFDAFGVEAIDEEIEDEEEDDGITPVSDKDGTESELLTQKSLVRLTRNIHTGFGKVHAEPAHHMVRFVWAGVFSFEWTSVWKLRLFFEGSLVLDISTEEVKDLVFSPEKEASKPLGLGAVSKERVELGPSLPLLSIPFVSADLSNGEVEMGSDSVSAKNGVASDEVSSSSGEEEGKTGSSSGEVEVEGNPEDPPSIGLVSVSGGDKDDLNQEEAELVDVDAVGDVGSGDFCGPAVKAASLNLGPVSSNHHVARVGGRASRLGIGQPMAHMPVVAHYDQPGAKAPSTAIASCSILPPSPASSASLLLGAIEGSGKQGDEVRLSRPGVHLEQNLLRRGIWRSCDEGLPFEVDLQRKLKGTKTSGSVGVMLAGLCFFRMFRSH
ncbi:hypothetical protein U1Q18_044434 [Sarracenia purpurea var. burkii]